MKLIILLLSSFVIANSTTAQTINIGGVVKDKTYNISIPSAKVVIINKNDLTERDSVLTGASGQWSYIFQTVDVKDDTYQPSSIALHQNYPNPFNPSTKIAFSVNEPGNVLLSVHNILGELIDYRNFELNPGSYSVDWESRGAAGVLFYTLQTGDSKITKKMIQLDGGSGSGLSNLTGNSLAPSSIPEKFNSRQTADEYYIVSSKKYYEADTAIVIISDGLSITQPLEMVHSKAFVIDLHNDVLSKSVGGYDIGIFHDFNHSDLPRFRSGGVDAQMLSIWTRPSETESNYGQAMSMIDTFYAQMARYPEQIGQARTADEAYQLVSEGKFAGIIAIEGGYMIEDDMEKLKTLYDRGMRYMTITWNGNTNWATSASTPESTTEGLTDFGRDVIRMMDSLGIIIDVSHTGIKTIDDILEITKNPIIASHSGARALRNHTRNLTDTQILDIAASGGVIGVVFYPPFLKGNSATILDVVNHINHIVSVAGIDHVGIGSDFDGIERVTTGLENVTRYPKLTEALINAGYSNEDVRKILGENFMRVFKEVCK